MRIKNNTSRTITLTDIDRGNAGETKGFYENWNRKTDNVLSPNGFINVPDTDAVMLSTELGQIKKGLTNTALTTYYSIASKEVGPFAITGGSNDTFNIKIGSGAIQSFSLPTGASVTVDDIVSSINFTATGFTAEKGRFFRASRTDDIIGAKAEGYSGEGYGVRGPSEVEGFLVLYSTDVVEIGNGNANSTLGFTEKEKTKCK